MSFSLLLTTPLIILCTLHNSIAFFFFFLRNDVQKFIQHSSYENIMNSQHHTDTFWFTFYSFQIIPVCFLNCCYIPSWCPQTAICSDSKILFHPTSWAFAIFKFQLKFLIHSVELSETVLQLLVPWTICCYPELCNLTWNNVIYNTKFIAWYLRSLWHFTFKTPPLWKLTIQVLFLFLAARQKSNPGIPWQF